MSLSINDARVFSDALKTIRKEKHLTQAACAELLDCSLSFQTYLERCRCSPSIENFYHICRTLDISADDCIFHINCDETNATYQALLRLLPLCDERSLDILLTTANALVRTQIPMDSPDAARKQA